MKQIMIFVVPVKLSSKIEKRVNIIVDQVNEILNKYADRNAELVSLTLGTHASGCMAVIQYDA